MKSLYGAVLTGLSLLPWGHSTVEANEHGVPVTSKAEDTKNQYPSVIKDPRPAPLPKGFHRAPPPPKMGAKRIAPKREVAPLAPTEKDFDKNWEAPLEAEKPTGPSLPGDFYYAPAPEDESFPPEILKAPTPTADEKKLYEAWIDKNIYHPRKKAFKTVTDNQELRQIYNALKSQDPARRKKAKMRLNLIEFMRRNIEDGSLSL